MEGEESLVVWQTFLGHLDHWRATLAAKGCLNTAGLNRMVIHMVSPLLAKHSNKGEAEDSEHVINLLLVELLKAAEDAGHDETISKAKTKFKALMLGDEDTLRPDELEQVLI